MDPFSVKYSSTFVGVRDWGDFSVFWAWAVPKPKPFMLGSATPIGGRTKT